MARNTEPQKFDPFSRAIPGQSFTDTPGLRPYESPPMSVDAEEIINVIEPELKDEETSSKIAELLDIGISCETISEALVQKCFTEGMCSPDVSELIKPAIFMIVGQIGFDNNIQDIELFNDSKDPNDGEMLDEDKMDMLKQMNPKKYHKIMEMAETVDFEEEDIVNDRDETSYEEDDLEDMMKGHEEIVDEMDMPESTGSFLDMASVENQAEEEVTELDEEQEIREEEMV